VEDIIELFGSLIDTITTLQQTDNNNNAAVNTNSQTECVLVSAVCVSVFVFCALCVVVVFDRHVVTDFL